MKCEEVFWKTNIKLSKLIKQIKCIKNDDIQLKLISYDALNAPRPCIKFMMRINSLQDKKFVLDINLMHVVILWQIYHWS